MHEMRRKERERDAKFAMELMKDCVYATLGTVGEDGSPYCVPISPVVVEGAVYFHCAVAGHKLENLIGEPRVCLNCVGQVEVVPEGLTTRYTSATLFGRAEILEGEACIPYLLALGEKYSGEYMEKVRTDTAVALGMTRICKITVERATGKVNG